MSADGNSSRERLLSRMGSSGLAVLLENEDNKECLVTAAACMVEECSRSTLERTLGYVLDTTTEGAEYSVIQDTKIDSSSIRLHLQSRLSTIGAANDLSSSYRDAIFIDGSNDPANGVIMMDKGSSSGDIKFMNRTLLLESQTIFSSARANVCVWKGKWMYEVTLGTAGIQQLGWATISCPFTDSEGVGDASNSYAYDGRRIRKWSEKSHPYGQPWVVGDVIGCCIDLESGQIYFYRNGISLGMAYDTVKRMEAKRGYYPAISLSHGERCELNFGGRPFRYPVAGYLPLQAPPSDTEIARGGHSSVITKVKYLFGCLQRLVQLSSPEVAAAMAPAERLRRFAPLPEDQFQVVGSEICKLLAQLLMTQNQKVEYVVWGAFVPFLMGTYRSEAPHDGHSVDRALDLLVPMLDPPCLDNIVLEVMECLAHGCRTSPLVLADCPYSGSYSYLALTCYLLQRDHFMITWWRSEDFESCLEGLLTRKGPNKFDLEALIPTVWWPGSREDHPFSESNMRQIVAALTRTISRIEDLQFEVCNRILTFVPPDVESNAPGAVFRTFLQNLVYKNRGAHRNMPPPGLSDNSVLVSVYTVLLRFLSEGLDSAGEGHSEQGGCVPFLHKGGKRSFPVALFVSSDACLNDFARLGGTYSYLTKTTPLSALECEEVEWEESSMDKEEARYAHDSFNKPCCCVETTSTGSSDSSKSICKALDSRFNGSPNRVSESSCPLSPTYAERNYEGDMESKPSSSGRVEPFVSTNLLQKAKKVFKSVKELSCAVREEELLDKMVLLYHLGVTQNFKQASYHMQHQIQLMAQLDDTDRQIRSDKTSFEHIKRLKEARALFREDLIDYVRQCTWYRVCLLSKWKQRGMYATCMWVAQLLVVISRRDPAFSYVPEFYIETLVDCFHALRRSDPLYVPPSALLQQGLASLVTFLVTHFHDPRIVNAEIRDFLLQSISVLVQFKEYLVAIEACKAAQETMAGALLSAFNNRFWIPVSNILLRLCKGSGFGASKSTGHGESCSPFFQRLLREKCLKDANLFAAFLNRLFNTLNWTISEFSVSIKEMQDHDHRQVPELQQRKCAIMFELSCNLERILEFFTKELPQAFLVGPEMNIIRLCELVLFVLNHTTSNAAAELFDSTVRQQGQSLEKVNRATILAPVVGIVLNLSAATASASHGMEHDIARAIANVDVSSVATRNFQYLLDYDWFSAFKGDPSLGRLSDLNTFIEKLKAEYEEARRRAAKAEADELMSRQDKDDDFGTGNADEDKVELCSICYAHEENAVFLPCKHRSCLRCVSRHLLNNQRCFFCNAAISEVSPFEPIPVAMDSMKAVDS